MVVSSRSANDVGAVGASPSPKNKLSLRLSCESGGGGRTRLCSVASPWM